MNKIKNERDRYEKEIENSKISLNDKNNQCQVNVLFFYILSLSSAIIINI